MKNYLFTCLVGVIAFLAIFSSCGEDEPVVAPTVNTLEATNITKTSANLNFNVSDNGGTTLTSCGVEYSLQQNFENGTGTIIYATNLDQSSFSIEVTGLSIGTTYYFKSFAENEAGKTYGNELEFITNSFTYTIHVTDIDGNTYPAVEIGNQIWMAKNLMVTKYSDGTSIPFIDNNTGWANLENNNIDAAYCWQNDDINNKDTYGALYTYAAATNGDNSGSTIQGACPDGWHLPSDSEWKELEIELGISQLEVDSDGWRGNNEGASLKSTTGWPDGTLSTDEYGFAAIPTGHRESFDGEFLYNSNTTYYWSSTEDASDDGSSFDRFLEYGHDGIHRDAYWKSNGLSIRCIKN